ncbi:hypothetical protein [Streptomyces sp. TR02-1]|uniref:hypothetical protein n=1 Tax=Streptomyces sp. TR02-1 TaxID=3385977 RepID=UPI0039A3886F
MTGRGIRNAVAAAVLTAAVAASGTACGADTAAPAPERAPSTGTGPVSTHGPSGGAGGGSRDPSTGPGAAPTGTPSSGDGSKDPPSVPKSELTPATGSFTRKEKKYLVDRVPRGTDPAAVLEAGQAVCDRITRTVEVDRQAAVSALRSGEIADPVDAVVQLCPEHEPLLEAAGLTGR